MLDSKGRTELGSVRTTRVVRRHVTGSSPALDARNYGLQAATSAVSRGLCLVRVFLMPSLGRIAIGPTITAAVLGAQRRVDGKSAGGPPAPRVTLAGGRNRKTRFPQP